MEKTCSICGQAQATEWQPGLLKCGNCGYVWADLTFSFDKTREIYGRSYFFGDEYSDYLAESDILKYGFRKFHRKLTALFTGRAEKPRLLEIGSAYGLYLDIAAYDFDVTGLEISPDAAAYARKNGHRVIQEDLLSIDAVEEFDIVVSFATLEHLLNPDRVMQQVYRFLKPGGYCYVTTIDIESLFSRLSGKKWRMIHPPTHVSYFSSRTLTALMQTAGFSVLECGPVWQYRSLDAVFLPRFENSVLYKAVNRSGLTKVPIPFNFGDIIGLLAKKPA